jgi:hypothetical protein
MRRLTNHAVAMTAPTAATQLASIAAAIRWRLLALYCHRVRAPRRAGRGAARVVPVKTPMTEGGSKHSAQIKNRLISANARGMAG